MIPSIRIISIAKTQIRLKKDKELDTYYNIITYIYIYVIVIYIIVIYIYLHYMYDIIYIWRSARMGVPPDHPFDFRMFH